MVRIGFALLEIAASSVILIPLHLILNYGRYRSGRKTAAYLVFSFYLVAVYTLVGLPSITYINPGLNLNLIPFVGMMDDLKNCILNVILFGPLGFFLPVLWMTFRDMKKTVCFGLWMSITIEIMQILVMRAVDINDVICNTAGTYCGCLMAEGICKVINMDRSKGVKFSVDELYLLFGSVFAVMFFVQPFIYSVLLSWML